MNSDQIKQMADLFLDDELEKEKESLLFTQLSLNEEAREYFKKLHALKTSVELDEKEFPIHLEENIFNSISKKEFKKERKPVIKKVFANIAYGFTIVLIVLTVFLLSKLNEYDNRVNQITKQIQFQNQTIELLYNSLPAAVISPGHQNEIIIKSNM